MAYFINVLQEKGSYFWRVVFYDLSCKRETNYPYNFIFPSKHCNIEVFSFI